MKAQFGSLVTLVVALVLLVAAVPSYATQHRDPVLPAENAHKASAESPSAAATPANKTHTNAKSRAASPKRPANKSISSSTKKAGDAKNHSGTGTGMK